MASRPDEGTVNVVREAVNACATKEVQEKGVFAIPVKRGPRVAAGFLDLHRFMFPNFPRGLKRAFHVWASLANTSSSKKSIQEFTI